MKMAFSLAITTGMFLLGCGQTNSEAPAPVASAAPSSAPAKPSVKRKTTAAALRVADEKECLAGKAEACRRMADRYRGYGHTAGCGLERSDGDIIRGRTDEKLTSRLKRLIEDRDADAKEFLTWIGKACDLGDSEACGIEGFVRAGRLPSDRLDVEYAGLLENVHGSALAEFVEATNKTKYEKYLKARNSCWFEYSTACWDLSDLLVTPEKDEVRPELTPELLAKLQKIGEKTLDFDSLYMVLDRFGHAPEALAPLKTHASKTLLEACVEGGCVCGEAAKTLPLDDPRVPDLARWGCENGEASGCYVLAKLYEEGKGVEKDEMFARSLYETACPSRRPYSTLRNSEFEQAACLRLAEMAVGGANPPKDRERTDYYMRGVCTDPGMEKDHSYCVKRAKYWTSGLLTTPCTDPNSEYCLTAVKEATLYMNGRKEGPSKGKECERPSVKAECDALVPEYEAFKKPAAKKK